MRSRLLLSLWIFSLLLCVGVVALWARSYWISDEWISVRPASYGILASSRGRALILIMTGSSPGPTSGLAHVIGSPTDLTAPPLEWQAITQINNPNWKFAGFRYSDHTSWTPLRVRTLIIPAWPILMIATAPAAVLSWRLLRRRRMLGICAACGYDLRATPERCPECGAVPSRRKEGHRV